MSSAIDEPKPEEPETSAVEPTPGDAGDAPEAVEGSLEAVKEASAESAPTGDAPGESTNVEETPTEAAPAEAASAEATPAEGAAAEAASVEATPAEGAAAEGAPGGETPAENAPTTEESAEGKVTGDEKTGKICYVRRYSIKESMSRVPLHAIFNTSIHGQTHIRS